MLGHREEAVALEPVRKKLALGSPTPLRITGATSIWEITMSSGGF